MKKLFSRLSVKKENRASEDPEEPTKRAQEVFNLFDVSEVLEISVHLKAFGKMKYKNKPPTPELMDIALPRCPSSNQHHNLSCTLSKHILFIYLI